MPLIEKIIVNNGIVGLFEMTETLEELEQQYANVFQELPIINSQHERRKKEWLSIRLLIADLVGHDFSILYDEKGKPELKHDVYKFISISHSTKYAVVYLHKSKQVGIDVESLGRRYAAIERKYLSDIEMKQVKNHPYLRAVYWCCKEAIFKWAGREGVDFQKQIRINDFNPDLTNTINAVFTGLGDQFIKLNFMVFDGHVLVYTW